MPRNLKKISVGMARLAKPAGLGVFCLQQHVDGFTPDAAEQLGDKGTVPRVDLGLF
jgi:hypothetical protein